MIEKIVKIVNLDETKPSDDLEYWLSRSPKERIEAVQFLRKQFNGNSARLQRTARISELKQS